MKAAVNESVELIIIIFQGIGQRPVLIQKVNFWTYESIICRIKWRKNSITSDGSW